MQPVTDPFGSHRLSPLWATLVRLCHDESGGGVSRFLAPIVRKLCTRRGRHTPIDIRVGDLNLRCRFADNYTEKKYVFTPWRYDRAEREALAAGVRHGGTFLDIGANIGLYSLLALKAMGQNEGQVFSFEPNPKALERLRFNLNANPQLGNHRASIVPYAVSDACHTLRLSNYSRNLGEGMVSRNVVENASTDVVEIQSKPLLTLTEENGISEIKVLKIDVEGHEDLALMPFLEKAPDYLLPKLIILEESPEKWSSNLIERLHERGYDRNSSNTKNGIFTLDTKK